MILIFRGLKGTVGRFFSDWALRVTKMAWSGEGLLH